MPKQLNFLALFVWLALAAGCSAAKTIPKLILIGDSTVMNYSSRLAPLTGYGQHLGTFFNASHVIVKDKAMAGRTSKSFYHDGHWATVKNTTLAAGDYVFIEFGHNDQTKHDTVANTTYKQYLNKYIEETRAAKAHPVLLTSINRCRPLANGTFVNTLGDFPEAARQVAKAHSVPLLDLNARTLEEFNRIGEKKALEYFLTLPAHKYANYPNGSTDRTHLQKKGALRIDQLIVQELKRIHHPLAKFVLPHCK